MTADLPDKTARIDVVLAIDPGRAKCGVAVVRREGPILTRAVVPTETLAGVAQGLCVTFRPDAVIVGNGTGSKPLRDALLAVDLPVPIEMVEESHTSEAARKRFLAENPANGWQRLLPRSLRTPDVPYDDYVAVLLAERYFERK